MDVILSPEVQTELDAARMAGLKKLSRYRVEVSGTRYVILRMFEDGFTVAADDTPAMRGAVDIYEGPAHLFQCLIIAEDGVEAGERRFTFKRATPVTTHPAADYVRRHDAPAGLIARESWT